MEIMVWKFCKNPTSTGLCTRKWTICQIVENFWMTSSLLEKKKMWNSNVVTEEELDDKSACIEPSLRKSLCWVVAGWSASKISAQMATKLIMNLEIYRLYRLGNKELVLHVVSRICSQCASWSGACVFLRWGLFKIKWKILIIGVVIGILKISLQFMKLLCVNL
jgi:hypothetical protein